MNCRCNYLFKSPSIGISSELAGIECEISFKKIMMEKSIVTPRGNFSPESGGKVNPKITRKAIKHEGTSKLHT
jgi:hypothetical protein